MAGPSDKISVYFEVGKKRVVAGALDWPGWCRVGRDEEGALQALLDYGPRYSRVLQGAGLNFKAPSQLSDFSVVERLSGDATTDFGAPSIAPSCDADPVDSTELGRIKTLLGAYWQAFDRVVADAEGKELSKGPRGGGRELDGVIGHVLESDASYLGRLAWKLEKSDGNDLNLELDRTRRAVLDALRAAVHGELPERGPRGGALWKPRYFVRRLGWHVLDHVWEIEDRVV